MTTQAIHYHKAQELFLQAIRKKALSISSRLKKRVVILLKYI